ncbi:alpha-terpineol synthase, chloroplastic-like [Dioscorea cayenensis subsp. rotundata]|uniref:Alpha-terpineol synthase, chloroplastic-like n=1 Tax=Dioscorea cayennensis subsp. rotundata TaxID=55577 RepID=A0AB40ATS4_DIOCR|nr:alpha-terpineol synthase, chloroplastic-like [Dioscorea cayenensis subsp. rotundata]
MASHNYLLSYSNHYAPMSMMIRIPFAAVNNGSLVTRRAATNCSFTTATTPSPEPPLRRSANYQPNQWDYNSITSLDSDYDQVKALTTILFAKMKEEVRSLIKQENEFVARLELIDDIEHLGLEHHFGEEIMDVLTSISAKSDHNLVVMKEDLHATALLFRLLRQHGLHVSQDVFSHFKDEKGSFRVSLLEKDVQGLLSLYEASFLGFNGEETLEEARDFTTKHLVNLIPCMHPHMKEKVQRSMELPLHWRMRRLEARWYIDQYKTSENMNPVLLQFAKLDFNLVQSTHHKELKKMIEWWKKLGLGERLSFARDRLVECFFCAVGIVFGPQHGFCREEITKVMALITTLDDVYDVYGSLDELQLFTKAVERWQCDGSEELPEYMKICYNSLYNTAEELANKIQKLEGWDCMPYIGKAWADLFKAFLREAEWHYSGYKPRLEEYLNNGWISVSGHVILVHVFLLSDRRGKTKEGLQHLMNYPNLIKSSSMIFRLGNDIATSAAELARGDTPTSMHCYMSEYNTTEDQARREIWNLISKSWKDLNEGLSDCSPLSLFFGKTAMNLARVMHCVYQHGDSHGAPDQDKENQIKSLFCEPMKLE